MSHWRLRQILSFRNIHCALRNDCSFINKWINNKSGGEKAKRCCEKSSLVSFYPKAHTHNNTVAQILPKTQIRTVLYAPVKVTDTIGRVPVTPPQEILLHGGIAGAMCLFRHDTFVAHDAGSGKFLVFAHDDDWLIDYWFGVVVIGTLFWLCVVMFYEQLDLKMSRLSFYFCETRPLLLLFVKQEEDKTVRERFCFFGWARSILGSSNPKTQSIRWKHHACRQGDSDWRESSLRRQLRQRANQNHCPPQQPAEWILKQQMHADDGRNK